MAYPLIQFVSDASTSATLRYDFHAKNASYETRPLGGDGLDLGTPSFTGDPDSAGAEYGYRRLSLTQRIVGTKTEAMSRMTTLARELLRAQNWLKVQVDATAPVRYFKTYRTEPGSLSLEHIETAGAWDIVVPLVADPFAYGARETLSPITINNDPVAGTNPCRAVLPTILGDAPAPLRILMNPGNATGLYGFRHMFAVHATTDSPAGPVTWAVGGTDGWTAGTDTAASSADATMSGGNRRVVSFATVATMATRISGSAPAALPAGKYKVLVRVARSDLDSTFGLRFGQNVAFSYRYGETVAFDRAASTAVGHAAWVDLGDFQHPYGHLVPAGQEGGAATPDVSLQAERRTGTGSLYLDAFLLVPLETTTTIQNRLLFSEQNLGAIDSGAATGTWDGDWEGAWSFNQFGVANSDFVAELQGQFPAVVPGATNTLHMLQQVNGRRPFFGQDNPDIITGTSVLTLSYYPRYLYLGN